MLYSETQLGSIKMLRLDHICIDAAERISPLWASCYGDEDMVALAKSGVVFRFEF